MNCKEAKERNENTLLRIPGVHGVGVGRTSSGKQCIKVFCDHPDGDTDPTHHDPPIPPMLDGFPVEAFATPPLYAFILSRRLHHIEGGFSIGHYAITAGTVATAVEDAVVGRSTGTFPVPTTLQIHPNPTYLLSNNHVLANSNNALIGDPILQPGPIDGGTIASDTIGRLTRYIPIQFAPEIPLEQHNNLVDAAIAEVAFEDVERKVRGIGYLLGWRPTVNIRINDPVQKTGRTTQHTVGLITAVNATVDVGYGQGRTARFKEQVITTGMAAGGDSGSLIVSLNNIAVGLLFAGSTEITVFNPIEAVQNLLRVTLSYVKEGPRTTEPEPPPSEPPPSEPPSDIPPHKHPIPPGPGETGPPAPVKK